MESQNLVCLDCYILWVAVRQRNLRRTMRTLRHSFNAFSSASSKAFGAGGSGGGGIVPLAPAAFEGVFSLSFDTAETVEVSMVVEEGLRDGAFDFGGMLSNV